MTDVISPVFEPAALDRIDDFEGYLAVILPSDGKLDALARRVNKLARGAVARFAESDAFADLKEGGARALEFIPGMRARGVVVAKLPRRADAATARKAGAAVARVAAEAGAMLLAGALRETAALVQGYVLRAYRFDRYKTDEKSRKGFGPLHVLVRDPDAAQAGWVAAGAAADGTLFARDLVNEPANVLTTTEFANRLQALSELGLKVTVLEEADMERLGMRALLAVGQGSASPSKLVILEWQGGGAEAPFALVGKGVVFDTGGISLKPPAGMEDMTMDMGGAAVVAGTMKALALRKAKANVVGLVGLVENMPSGTAQRPGDVVKSMKGDTIEVINTDAEGRLVLADVLWYAQETFNPSGIVDLATLTGAMIIALGHETAGFFANDDKLADRLSRAARAEDEAAWRLPLGPAYHKLIEARIADIKNTGGRPAGAITAAAFLERFIREGMPWVHIDIAGVASLKKDTELAPKGATGWGVRTLDRMIADFFEAKD